MVMRFERWLAVGTAITLCLGAIPASAQLTGGPIVPANPGGFSGDIAIGAIQTDLSPYPSASRTFSTGLAA
jgi:hypothetical protein